MDEAKKLILKEWARDKNAMPTRIKEMEIKQLDIEAKINDIKVNTEVKP